MAIQRLENEEEFSYAHRTVNHSKYFKDPMTVVHINTIEGYRSKQKLIVFHKVEQKYHTKYFRNFMEKNKK